MTDALTLETFQIHLGERFHLEVPGDRQLDFELTSVSPLADHAWGNGNDGRRAPFSLLFLGPEGIGLPQATYHFTHRELGDLEMFVVPIERVGNRLRYEAIFS